MVEQTPDWKMFYRRAEKPFYNSNWSLSGHALDLLVQSVCGLGSRSHVRLELIQFHSDIPENDKMLVNPKELIWDTQYMATLFVGNSTVELSRFLRKHNLPRMPRTFYNDFRLAKSFAEKSSLGVRRSA